MTRQSGSRTLSGSRTGDRLGVLPESPPSYDSLFPYQSSRRRSHSEPSSYEPHARPQLPSVASSSAVQGMVTGRCRHCSDTSSAFVDSASSDTSSCSSSEGSTRSVTHNALPMAPRPRLRQSPSPSPLLTRRRSRSESTGQPAGHTTPSQRPRPRSATGLRAVSANSPRPQLVRRRSRSDPPSRDELRREAMAVHRTRSSGVLLPTSTGRPGRRRSHSGPAGYDQQRREAVGEQLTPLQETTSQSSRRSPLHRQRSNSDSDVRQRHSWKRKSTKRKILEGGLAAAWIPLSPLMFFIEFVVREPPRTAEDYLGDPALSVWYRAIRKFSNSGNGS